MINDDLATLNLTLVSDGSARAEPLYLQLAAQLRGLIMAGRLAPGERLPSSRKLAELLAISRTSTLNGYDQLIAEGLLISRPGSGVYVSELTRSLDGRDTPAAHSALTTMSSVPPINNSAAPLSSTAPSSTLAHRVFDAGPDLSQFPFAEWSRSLARVWRRPDPGLLRDPHPGGYWPLRQAVARYLGAVRDIRCAPEQVIITAGSRDSLMLLARALLQPGDPVALDDPCYPPLLHGLRAQGADIQACPVDQQGMGVAARPVRLAWISSARQYPLGISMSTERRLEWLAHSRTHDSWLIEDDYDAEFHYRRSHQAPLFNLAAQLPPSQQRVVLVGSFSKLMFRNLRIGYLVAPEPLIEPLLAAQRHLGALASVPVQPALADFLGHRRFAAHLRRMRRCYQQRRDLLDELLNQQLSQQLTWQLPDSGMHLLAHLRPQAQLPTDTELERRLNQQGIQAPALSSHYHQAGTDEKSRQGLLLGFSGTDEEQLRTGVAQLAACLQGED